MKLGDTLVVSRTPVTNACKAEAMITSIQDTKLSSVCEYLHEADVAFFVVLLDVLFKVFLFLESLTLLLA